MNTEVEARYQEALDYLYSFVDYSLTRNFRYSAEKFDLSRMRELMVLLGNPQNRFPVIHVAGTKGKGSTSAMISSVLQEAGYRVGFYTSPHLENYTERIQINRIEISHAEMVSYVERLRPAATQIEQITTFELTTALALMYFADQAVDIAVLEVGLGGRLDATNIVDPLVSVITSLSYDHMNVLGDTLGQIAAEKAGIIKEGRPVVVSPQRDEAQQVVHRIAHEKNAPLVQVGKDWLFTPVQHSLKGQTFWVWNASEQELMDRFVQSNVDSMWKPFEIQIPLLGLHQVENAATAFSVLQILKEKGYHLSPEDIHRGFSNVIWHGRFEILQDQPLLIVDSAHNPDSASKLRMTIRDYTGNKPVILVFGASEDKDIPGMFKELLPGVQQLIATQSIHPRAMEAEKLVEIANQFNCPARVIIPVETAISSAVQMAGKDAAVVVTGSIFVAAAARQYWREHEEIRHER